MRQTTTTILVVMSSGLRNDHKLVGLTSLLCARRVFPASMYGLVNWMTLERAELITKAAAAKSTFYTTNHRYLLISQTLYGPY